MLRIHLIAIGGSAMHSLAIEMLRLGHNVSGSDDLIFDPAKENLEKAGILPKKMGWYEEKINEEIDIVILGMHARKDNPELLRAKDLGLVIKSYPEFLADYSVDKSRVVIAGSHGKTTITSLIIHALNYNEIEIDFMVGAKLKSYNNTVKLSEENNLIIFEGDEYLSSPIDLQPKFLWYKPEIALISGIAWDHINVFPTFENYTKQFDLFISSIKPGGVLIFNNEDKILKQIVEANTNPIKKIPYMSPNYKIENNITYLETEEGDLPLSIFGHHNLLNVEGARWISQLMGLDISSFYEALPTFKGASNRLELITRGKTSYLYKDFAHAPSKVIATVQAVKNQFKDFKITVCLELHTFSSLDANFLKEYANTLDNADDAIIFYDPEALKIKNRIPLDPKFIKEAFANKNIEVLNSRISLNLNLFKREFKNKILLMMSSGNFGDLNWKNLKNHMLKY